MISSNNYNQFVGDIKDLEFLLEDDKILNEKKIKRKGKGKIFDDGTSIKHNTKKYTRYREKKE